MIILPTSWLYPGKNFRNLVRLNTLDKDSIFHSFMTCVYPPYRSLENIYDKFVYISRLKKSLMDLNKDYEEIIKKGKEDEFLSRISRDFEVNIYLMNCKKDDTIIHKTYINDEKYPTILIEKCSLYYPLGIKEKNGIHTMFFNVIDDEIIRCLEMFDKSSISEDYKESVEEEFKIDVSYIFKYDVAKILNSLKHKKLKNEH